MNSSAFYRSSLIAASFLAAVVLATSPVAHAAPEIDVQQPAGASLMDGNAEVSFGFSPVGQSQSVTFTISNLGTADLTGLMATVDGTNSTNFQVSAQPAQTLASGASTTFQVVFTPDAVAPRQADLHIVSNDADESPYDISLSGTGLSASSQVLWMRTEPIDNYPKGIVVTPSGDSIVATSTVSYPALDIAFETRLEKRSGATGEMITSTAIQGFQADSMITAPDGDLLLAGRSRTVSGVSASVRKVSTATLATIWQFNRSGTASPALTSDFDRTAMVGVDEQGRVIVRAAFDNLDGSQSPILKLDANGNQVQEALLQVWEYQNNLSTYNPIYATVARDGTVFTAGTRLELPESESDPWPTFFSISRLNPGLDAATWVQSTPVADLFSIYFHKLVTDASGNPIAFGQIGGKFGVRKWNAATGEVMWTYILDETGEYDSGALDLKVDSNGDVVATGWSVLVVAPETSPDNYVTTVKLSGSTGAELWRMVYDNTQAPGTGMEMVIEPATDNVIVGRVNWDGEGDALSLLRYASDDGELLDEVNEDFPFDWLMLRQADDGSLYVVALDWADYGVTVPTYYATLKFAPFATSAPIQTLAATEVTATSARLNGIITPGSVDLGLVFEWSSNVIPAPRPPLQSFNITATATPNTVFAYSPATPFFTDLTNLQPHTTYHFRARANFLPSTAVWGENLTFTTLNRNPVANTDAITVSYQSSFPVSPLVNDTEADNDPLTLESFTQPTHGTVTRSGDTLTYAAGTGYYGLDSFTYTVTDGFGGSSIGTVNVTVTQTFNVWLNQHDLTGVDAQDDADPDGDGVKNLLEFAAGTLPRGSSVFSTPVTFETGSPFIEFIYQINKLAVDSVSYEVQWTDALGGPWASTGVTESLHSDDGIIQQMKALVPAGLNGHRFVRLKVTKL